MRKFKVECLFDSFGGEDTHWQEVEAENYEQAEEKARGMYSCDIDIGEILDIYDTPLNSKYVLSAVAVKPPTLGGGYKAIA